MRRYFLPLALLLMLLSATLVIGCGDTAASGTTSGGATTATSGSEQSTTTGGTEAAREKVTITLVSSFDRNALEHAGFWMFVDKLAETSNGDVVIDYKGASEVVPAAEQAQAVQSGMIDAATLPEAYYPHLVPEVATFKLSLFTPSEERENGLYDLWNEIHKQKLNAVYLGRTQSMVPYQLFTNVEIKTLDDFKGLRIRSSATYKAMLTKLGASPVSISASELHSAVQRNIVDGFGWSGIGVHGYSWDEVTKYEIEPGFYNSSTVLIMNLDKWNSLPQWAQDAINQAMIETDPEMVAMYQEEYEKEKAARAERGMQVLTLEGDAKAQFLDAAYTAGWDEALAASPDNVAKIKAICDTKPWN